METLIVNIPFIIVIAFLIFRIVFSVKHGFAKELCSFIAAIVASLAVLLIAFAVKSYFNQTRIIFVITLILLFLLLVLYKIVDMILDPLKRLIGNLPLVSVVDKVLGIVVGVAEVIVVVWAIYCLVMVMDAGAFEKWVMDCVRANKIMRTLYEYNYMYMIVAKFSSTLQGIDIWAKLGM